jgi:hypothetical protein
MASFKERSVRGESEGGTSVRGVEFVDTIGRWINYKGRENYH